MLVVACSDFFHNMFMMRWRALNKSNLEGYLCTPTVGSLARGTAPTTCSCIPVLNITVFPHVEQVSAYPVVVVGGLEAHPASGVNPRVPVVALQDDLLGCEGCLRRVGVHEHRQSIDHTERGRLQQYDEGQRVPRGKRFRMATSGCPREIRQDMSSTVVSYDVVPSDLSCTFT